ncbi:MAG: hypothetical protein KDA94_14405 [Acidimicrobiales bacterium]|nr:hypothetical protein [Acidimicrobiales bacterium]
MAIYIPTRTRRRRALAAASIALVIGIGLGLVAGRASAPSARDQIRAIQADGREVSAGLRVLSLHGEAGLAGDADGTDLALDRTESQLRQALEDAIWVRADERDELLASLERLTAIDDRATVEFGDAAAELADQIDEAFGNAPS